MSALDSLLVVQEHDTVLDQLRHRRATLPERAHLAAVEHRLIELDAQLADARVRRDEVAARQAALEAEIATADARIIEVEKRLYGGTVSASRELTAMSEEVDHLKARRSATEDKVLEVMEEREPNDLEVVLLETTQADLDNEVIAARDALAAAEQAMDIELSAKQAERDAAAVEVPADLAATYERLRSKLGGVGAAKLVGTQCSGCHLTLPATELDRVRHAKPDELFFCDQCGRILVH
jgi:uncharacterized protein